MNDAPPPDDSLDDAERMRALLDETKYDTDLGMALARDAQRVVAGDMSEEEFHDRYHDAIVDEFGVDNRPIVPEDPIEENDDGDRSAGKLLARVTGLEFDGDQSRRDMLKKSGAVAGALSIGIWGTAEAQSTDRGGTVGAVDEADDDNRSVQFGMVIDLDRCDGCLGCVEACQDENHWELGANWMYVMAYEEDGREDEDYLVRPCQHCSNAPCEKVCPVEARHTRDKDGLVLTNYDTCIGCRYCQVACPYGVNYFQWGEPEVPFDQLPTDHTHDERGMWVDSRPPKGVMGKCTFCPTRQDDPEQRGTVACMDMCDEMGMRAIHFGDLRDPESRPNQYLRKRREAESGRRPGPETTAEDIMHTSTDWGDISTFRLLEDKGTEPNVLYIGNEPGQTARQVEGPVKYEAIGTVDRRKDVLDYGARSNRGNPIPGLVGGDDR